MKLSELSENFEVWLTKYQICNATHYFVWFNNHKKNSCIPTNKKTKKIISILQTSKEQKIDFEVLKHGILNRSGLNIYDTLKIINYFNELKFVEFDEIPGYSEDLLIELATIKNKRKINFKELGGLISLFDDWKRLPKIKYCELDKILQYYLESVWKDTYQIRQRIIKIIDKKTLHQQTKKYLFELTSIWDIVNEI